MSIVVDGTVFACGGLTLVGIVLERKYQKKDEKEGENAKRPFYKEILLKINGFLAGSLFYVSLPAAAILRCVVRWIGGEC